MAFIPVPNTVEVAIEWTMPGAKPARIVFNVTSAVAWTLSAAEALASDVVDAIVSDGLAWITNAMSAASIHITDLSSASGFSFDWLTGSGTNTLPVAGTFASPVTGGQAALVTTLRTGSRGRSFRGRNYWPGIPAAEVNLGGTIIAPTRVTDQNAFVGSLIAAVHANPQRTVVVASKHTAGAPRVTGITTPVTSHDTNSTVDTQRRRVQP